MKGTPPPGTIEQGQLGRSAVTRGRRRRALVWVRTACLLLAPLAPAIETRAGDASTTPPAAVNPANSPEVKVVGPGILQLGQVRIDKQRRTVSFSAVLNGGDGIMEYLLVTSYGKTHESILRTDVSPFEIHLAMLLLGAKGNGTNPPASAPPAYGASPGTKLEGEAISVELRWPQDAKEATRRGEELVWNRPAQSAMPSGLWFYNGSVVWQGRFLAQESGSVISLITDPAALINNKAPSRDADGAWAAYRAKLPPENTPVQVTIRLANPKHESGAGQNSSNPLICEHFGRFRT